MFLEHLVLLYLVGHRILLPHFQIFFSSQPGSLPSVRLFSFLLVLKISIAILDVLFLGVLPFVGLQALFALNSLSLLNFLGC